MKTLGNLIWFIVIGFWNMLAWGAVGLLWSITIVGIPVGVQCFKIAGVFAFPFKKEIIYQGGAGSFLLNILWLIFGGLELAMAAFVSGLICCITLIGIPFGLQCFKLARVALMPFGSRIVPVDFIYA